MQTPVIAFAVLSLTHLIILNITSSHGQLSSTIYFTNGPGNHFNEFINNQVSSTITGLPKMPQTSFAFLFTISKTSIDWISGISQPYALSIFIKSRLVYHFNSTHKIALISFNL
ncbi:TPA: hypothetical protein DEG21_03805 [Patescibacteria group bacterium]|nr:hypothetical protein [Candidatus Gracilibacteria bacterium]HBY74975.1 hypothetical protein [Candidatus Gracilibacteria bacterium]